MATNVNWFVIWVPSSTTEMRRRRDTAPEEMTRTKTAGGKGGNENNLRDGEELSSDLTRVTSVVSGKFAVTGVKEDGDEKVNGKSLPSRKTSLFDVSKVEEEPVLNGTVLKDAIPERRVSSSQNTTDVTKQDTNNDKDEVESEDEDEEDLLELETMEEIVKRVIKDKNIISLHIISSHDDKQTQISFCVTFDRVEDILLELQSNGIGQAEQCTIRYSCSLNRNR